MVRFRELYGNMPGILVPGVLLGYSGKRVITSEWIDGEKVLDPRRVLDPHITGSIPWIKLPSII